MGEANSMLSEAKLPESPRLPMEFLSRSWSLPALQLSKALPSFVSKTVASCTTTPPILEDDNAPPRFAAEDQTLQNLKQRLLSGGHPFSFVSSTTSQLVLERIMSQSEVSPMTSGRPSCSDPITSLNDYPSESPEIPLSPPDHEFDYSKFLYPTSTPQPLLPTPRAGIKSGGSTPGAPGAAASKTVGRWLKDRKEKKKEETRVHNAQLHASISVAAVAAAIAATTAATSAASSASKKDEQTVMTDMAMASAATLVAAQCVEAAEAMGAEHEHLHSVISSAVNIQSHGDIMTLTAAAATALRGAATLKARTMKEVCNIASVLPVEKGFGTKSDRGSSLSGSHDGDSAVGNDFLGLCNEQLLARGSELLKRTRTGDLHWKTVSVYINKEHEVVLKMKSKHVARTYTKKKKKVLSDVCKDTRPWPERYMVEGEEEKRYFGLKTVSHRVIEFECKNQKEFDLWTKGVSRLLSIAPERKNRL